MGFGYWMNYKVLAIFVNNTNNDLSTDQITLGIDKYLIFLFLFLCCTSILLLLAYYNDPQVIDQAIASAQKELCDNPKKYDPYTDKIEPRSSLDSLKASKHLEIDKPADRLEIEKPADKLGIQLENDQLVKDKQFWPLLRRLMRDPVFILINFGAMLGTNTLGGHDVSLAVINNQFGISESTTLRLADSDMLGTIIGKLGYLALSYYTKQPLDELLWCLLIMHGGFFVYWYGIMTDFSLAMLGRLVLIIGNAPILPICMTLVIGYYNKADPDLVLLSTTTISIVKETSKAVAGTYVGIVMNTQTQLRSILALWSFQVFCWIAFLCGVALYCLLKKKGIKSE